MPHGLNSQVDEETESGDGTVERSSHLLAGVVSIRLVLVTLLGRKSEATVLDSPG